MTTVTESDQAKHSSAFPLKFGAVVLLALALFWVQCIEHFGSLRDDAYIIGAYNADPRDHARTAAITATSAQPDSPPANVITGQTRSVITSGKDASIGSGGGIPASQARLCLIRFPRGLVLLAGCCCYGLLLWWVVGVAGCWFGVMISFVQFREGSWQTVSRTGDSVHVPHAPRGC